VIFKVAGSASVTSTQDNYVTVTARGNVVSSVGVIAAGAVDVFSGVASKSADTVKKDLMEAAGSITSLRRSKSAFDSIGILSLDAGF
jgi:hypothetical protein